MKYSSSVRGFLLRAEIKKLRRVIAIIYFIDPQNHGNSDLIGMEGSEVLTTDLKRLIAAMDEWASDVTSGCDRFFSNKLEKWEDIPLILCSFLNFFVIIYCVLHVNVLIA